MNVESQEQFADFKIVCKSTFTSIALLVDADLQLWEVKSPELILALDIVNFIHREILSFDAFLCGFTVVINKGGSPDTNSLCSMYAINVVTGQRSLEVKALNISGFCL